MKIKTDQEKLEGILPLTVARAQANAGRRQFRVLLPEEEARTADELAKLAGTTRAVHTKALVSRALRPDVTRDIQAAIRDYDRQVAAMFPHRLAPQLSPQKAADIVRRRMEREKAGAAGPKSAS